MPDFITKEEIFTISDIIINCIVENPETFDIFSDDYENCNNYPEKIDDEYYVKIWFKHIFFGVEQSDGRKEFIANNKEDIISEITEFIKEREQLNLKSLSDYKKN